MASIQVVSGPIGHFPSFPTENRLGAIRNAAIKTFFFSLIATVFAFVLILTIAVHP
jgi:hypothetical protein